MWAQGLMLSKTLLKLMGKSKCDLSFRRMIDKPKIMGVNYNSNQEQTIEV
jgi:hypothetical protein